MENECANTCAICLNKINKECRYITKCNHIFHDNCINKWFSHNHQGHTCPVCRKEYRAKNRRLQYQDTYEDFDDLRMYGVLLDTILATTEEQHQDLFNSQNMSDSDFVYFVNFFGLNQTPNTAP